MNDPPNPRKSEALRRALAWLAQQGPWTAERIEQASLHFDLSPADEQFLLEQARRSSE